MKLLGLSPTTLWLLFGCLGTALLVLHLLRVRVRQVVVPSLLFYTQANEVRRPRTLWGAPSRWLSLLIGLLLLASLLWAMAEPWQARGPSATSLRPTGQRVQGSRIPADRVLQVGATVRSLRTPREPHGYERLRNRDSEPQFAARGGEAVRVGRQLSGIAPSRLAKPVPKTVPQLWHAQLLDAQPRQLLIESDAERAELRFADGQSLAASIRDGRCMITGLADPAQTATLTLIRGNASSSHSLRMPERRVAKVLRPTGLPMAVRAAMAATPNLQTAAPGETADLQVCQGDQPLQPGLPALLLQPGVETAPRQPLCTDRCPLRLSLRDRQQTGTALRPVPGETVWVVDSRSGAPLVAAHRHGEDGTLRLRIVDWLLGDAAHRDVPRLLIGCMRILAELPDGNLSRGRDVSVAEADGPRRQADLRATTVTTTPMWPSAKTEPAVYRGGSRGLAGLFLVAAVLLLLLDGWLLHRGRTA